MAITQTNVVPFGYSFSRFLRLQQEKMRIDEPCYNKSKRLTFIIRWSFENQNQ